MDDTQELEVLEAGRELEEVAAAAECCRTGPKPNLPEPEAT